MSPIRKKIYFQIIFLLKTIVWLILSKIVFMFHFCFGSCNFSDMRYVTESCRMLRSSSVKCFNENVREIQNSSSEDVWRTTFRPLDTYLSGYWTCINQCVVRTHLFMDGHFVDENIRTHNFDDISIGQTTRKYFFKNF